MITQNCSQDPILCPVKIWAKIASRIFFYPNSTENTPINSFLLTNNKMIFFLGPELLKKLRLAATSIGPDVLGFTADQIDLHSARSGAAMAMYLAGVSIFTIMLLGCWSRDAFLRYIRKQVKEFSKGISNKMTQNENFFTITEQSLGDRNLPDSGQHP
jgi:hypothetical protein